MGTDMLLRFTGKDVYKRQVQYKYKGGNYYDFLNRIGYAEDKEYTSKIGRIVTSL